MRLRVAVLCDYAEVREGVLTIVSAGITRLWRPALPAPFGVTVAVQLELDAVERAFPHEIQVVAKAPSGAEVAKGRGGLQVVQGGAGPDPDEGALVSVPLDLRNATVKEFGWHTVEITVDDVLLDTMRCKVSQPAQPSGPVPLMNRQARRHSKPN